jgi:hypothetical protein
LDIICDQAFLYGKIVATANIPLASSNKKSF